jgi:DNA-binding phage protein
MMGYWGVSRIDDSIDMEVLEESALAMAQATIQNAINDVSISRADLARKMNCNRSFVSKMLSGSHNLTVKTMSRALSACGFEVRFQKVPIVWNWQPQIQPANCNEALPAQSGSAVPIPLHAVGTAVPDWL